VNLKNIYRKYFRNHLFVKVIFVFTVIVNLTIVSLSYLFFTFMSDSIVKNELDKQKEAMDRVNRYLDQKYGWLQSSVQDIYQNNDLAANVSYLLNHSYEDYIEYVLNEFFANRLGDSGDALDFFSKKMQSDPDIRNIVLYSSEMQQMYVYQANAQPKLYSTIAARSFIPDAMAMEGPIASTPNLWVRKAIGQWDPQLYSMRSLINDKFTLKNAGQLYVYFDSEAIRNSLPTHKDEFMGTILALTPDGQVLFDSSGAYYGKTFPYMDKIKSLKQVETLKEPSYLSALTQSPAGFMVVGIAPVREVAKSYLPLKRTIMTISAVCIAFAIIIPSLVILNVSRRTNKIVRFMKRAKGGDLAVRLQDSREDELGQISRSFDEMLEELNRLIVREYKAEIERKRTELAALQARVNPHFLYNTLEVIRMRAISQGADDVGKMIYSLAALFRSAVRSNPESTLREELEMCKLYLELFRIRYKDKFSYEIDCEPDLSAIQVPKMLVQPLVENYIVHGLEPERQDNRIAIKAGRVNGTIQIQVQDNGAGIEPDKLNRIRQMMELPEFDGESFGLRSVRERLKLIYGPVAGVRLESTTGSGTAVVISFPEKGWGDI
jgi:two-component system sensor histidine kinase YesM